MTQISSFTGKRTSKCGSRTASGPQLAKQPKKSRRRLRCSAAMTKAWIRPRPLWKGTQQFQDTVAEEEETPMMREAIDHIYTLRDAQDDDEVEQILDSVAMLTDRGVDMMAGLRTVGGRRPARLALPGPLPSPDARATAVATTGKRGACAPAGARPKKKILIEFDLDEVKTVSHVLVHAKSTAKTLQVDAENLAATAATLAANFESTGQLLDQ